MKILFLSNNRNTKKLYEWLCGRCEVFFWEQRVDLKFLEEVSPDLVISYNYKYMIKDDVIKQMQGNVINLHISFLPWNRGSNPNYWSFVENTPKGVTIHQISPGLDEGAIIYQRELEFNPSVETFATTYEKLNEEITCLFMENWDEIRDRKYVLKKQSGEGSYHNMRDFEDMTAHYPVVWTENISDYLRKINKS